METATLVKTAMEAVGVSSTRAFALKAHVSPQAVQKWLRGDAVPSFEQCMCLAKMAGLDPVSTAAAVRLNSKDAAPFRGLLRRLAQAAACLAIAVGLSPRANAVEAPERAVAAFSVAQAIHYAHSCSVAVWRVLCGFLTSAAGFLRWRPAPSGPLAGFPV